MKDLDAQDQKLIKRLVAATLEAGAKAPKQLGPALKRILAERSQSQRRAFIKAFLKQLRRQWQLRELVIEHAGPLDKAVQDQIVNHFSQLAGDSLHVRTEANPDLIGGVRVRLGDQVYDASIAAQLNRLQAAVR